MDQRLRYSVLARDRGECLAPNLGAGDQCRNQDGSPPARWGATLELDHVRPQVPWGQLAKPQGVGGFAKRPADKALHLATLCWWHHQGGWATANRPVLRAYLLARAFGQGYWDAVAVARRAA